MKKILVVIAVVFMASAIFFACKKTSDSNSSFSGKQNRFASLGPNALMLACEFETLSGHITADRTLSASVIYKIDGCVTVDNNVTLNIPQGTVLQGVKTPTGGGKSSLIIAKGGNLVAVGTATNPVIFTSDQAPGSRNPGDWAGIVMLGDAPVASGTKSRDMGCATYTGGGSTSADNSGSLQYVQIHFAGALASSPDLLASSLTLIGVGTGTTIDHIQITNTLNDGLRADGGAVKLTNIVSYNTDRTDYAISNGNIGQYQTIAALRLNNIASPTQDAYGIDITELGTHPKISNATVLGPNFCNGTSVDANFQYAIRIGDGGVGEVYNSLFSSWNNRGFFINGSISVGATASNALQFSYNSFDNSSTPYSSTTWSSACESNMTLWIEGTGTLACKEAGYQVVASGELDYNSSFCDGFCTDFSSNFILGGDTDMFAANFSWDSGNLFSHVTYRGAFGTSTDWTRTWSDWCPQTTVYCTP